MRLVVQIANDLDADIVVVSRYKKRNRVKDGERARLLTEPPPSR